MGLVWGFASVFFMASMPVMNKFILQSTSAGVLALSNALLAGTVFTLISLSITSDFRFPRDKAILGAGVSNGLGLVLMFFSLKYLHPAVMGFVGRLGIVFALIISFKMFSHRPSRAELTLAVVAILGALGSASSDLESSNLLGVFLSILSTLAFTFSNAFLKLASKKHKHNQILATSNLIAALILLVFCFLDRSHVQIPHDSNIWLLIVAGALSGSCLGFWFYLQSLNFMSLSKASIVRATSPLFTAAFSYPFFGLHLSLPQILSATILIVSLVGLAILKIE